MLELIRFYRSPTHYIATTPNYTALIAQARDQAMLGSLYYHLQQLSPDVTLPPAIQRHLISGKVYADKHHLGCFNELRELCQDLQQQGLPNDELKIVFVKGVAYKLRGLKFAQGRTFSDVDILVPPEQFARAVDALKAAGFIESTLSDYDRNYYLHWSHQYPPLFHYIRGTGVDLHHGIIPSTSKTRISTAHYLRSAQKIDGLPYYLPSDAYLFIHAAVHLFLQEEHHKLGKDLCELNELGRELYQTPSWPTQLWLSATEAGASQVVYLALSVLSQLFEQAWAKATLKSFDGTKPAILRLYWHKTVLTRLLNPDSSPLYYIAMLSWYCRGHLHKMGFFRLLKHSLTKYWQTRKQQKILTAEQQQTDSATKPKDAGIIG